MKYLSLIIAFACLPVIVNAQEWFTDFEKAKKVAKEESKDILMVFQGSDWCAPCIKLSREVWETEEFMEYAKGHFVMVQVDFPRQKKNALPPDQQQKNGALAEQYNKNGIFPLVVILDADGHVHGETGYLKYSAAKYIEHINSFLAE